MKTSLDSPRIGRRLILALFAGLGVAVVVALLVSYALTIWFWIYPDPIFGPRYRGLGEMFARAFLIVSTLLVLWRCHSVGAITLLRSGPGWQIWLFWAFLLGVLAAVVDPFANIRREENVIRYATSGMLVGTFVFLAFASLVSLRGWGDKLFLFLLGCIFLFGAADEVFMIHEWIGEHAGKDAASDIGLGVQDLTTLLPAIGGFVVAVALMIWLWRMRQAGGGLRPASQRAIYLFCAACGVFLIAMLLDSFDWFLEAKMNALLVWVFADGDPSALLQFLQDKVLIKHLSNTVEEVLELSAATLFCAMALVIRDDRVSC